MASEVLTGKDGLLTFAAGDTPNTVNVYEWELTIDRDIHENTNFGADSNALEHIGGMAQATLVARCRIDSTIIPQIGTMATGGSIEAASVTCDLVATTPYNIVFSGLIESITPVVQKTQLQTVDITIKSGQTEPTFDQT